MSRTRPVRDEDRTGFTGILEDLVQRSPGLLGVAIVDNDGEAVDYAGRLATFQLKLAGAVWRIVLSEAEPLWAKRFGTVHRIAVRANGRGFVVRSLPEGYALVLVLGRYALDASARALARAERMLANEAGWPAPVEQHPWHAVEVETALRDRRRPQRIRAGADWQSVVVLGAMVGLHHERGYRVRTASGAELTLVREALGHWYCDESPFA
jgi:hypothetical protein